MTIDVHAHIIGPAFYDAMKKIPGVTTVPNRYGMGILKNGETVININPDWFDSIINGIFARYPDMKFIVAHTGAGMLGIMNRLRAIPNAWPDAREKMQQRPFDDYAKNLYYDSCSIDQNSLMLAYNYVGRQHMMFGTDYPYTNHGPDHVQTLPISAEDKEFMLSGNAERVFGLS